MQRIGSTFKTKDIQWNWCHHDLEERAQLKVLQSTTPSLWLLTKNTEQQEHQTNQTNHRVQNIIAIQYQYNLHSVAFSLLLIQALILLGTSEAPAPRAFDVLERAIRIHCCGTGCESLWPFWDGTVYDVQRPVREEITKTCQGSESFSNGFGFQSKFTVGVGFCIFHGIMQYCISHISWNALTCVHQENASLMLF